eukprot:1071597_1
MTSASSNVCHMVCLVFSLELFNNFKRDLRELGRDFVWVYASSIQSFHMQTNLVWILECVGANQRCFCIEKVVSSSLSASIELPSFLHEANRVLVENVRYRRF